MMIKDYAKKRRMPSSGKPRARYATHAGAYEDNFTLMPSWAWMSAGLILGLTLSAMLFWKFHRTQASQGVIIDVHDTVAPKVTPKAKPKVAALSHKEQHATSSRFDFYTVLPAMSTDAPEKTVTASADTEPQEVTTTAAQSNPDAIADKTDTVAEAPSLPSAPVQTTASQSAAATHAALSYIIQAGSFRQLHQAEELKAKLALSGIEASVQTFKLGENDIRYRVYIGPFESKEKATHRQHLLEQMLSLHSLVIKNRV